MDFNRCRLIIILITFSIVLIDFFLNLFLPPLGACVTIHLGSLTLTLKNILPISFIVSFLFFVFWIALIKIQQLEEDRQQEFFQQISNQRKPNNKNNNQDEGENEGEGWQEVLSPPSLCTRFCLVAAFPFTLIGLITLSSFTMLNIALLPITVSQSESEGDVKNSSKNIFSFNNDGTCDYSILPSLTSTFLLLLLSCIYSVHFFIELCGCCCGNALRENLKSGASTSAPSNHSNNKKGKQKTFGLKSKLAKFNLFNNNNIKYAQVHETNDYDDNDDIQFELDDMNDLNENNFLDENENMEFDRGEAEKSIHTHRDLNHYGSPNGVDSPGGPLPLSGKNESDEIEALKMLDHGRPKVSALRDDAHKDRTKLNKHKKTDSSSSQNEKSSGLNKSKEGVASSSKEENKNGLPLALALDMEGNSSEDDLEAWANEAMELATFDETLSRNPVKGKTAAANDDDLVFNEEV